MNKRSRKNPPRAKVMPDSLFCHLWNLASNIDDYDSFLGSVFSDPPKELKSFWQKYKISSDLTMCIMKNIFRFSHLSMKDILLLSGKKKSELRDIFCIPTRTIEDWCYGKNRCPSYVRIMILKHFHLLDLGDYVYLESDIERERSKPHIYERRKEKKDYPDITPHLSADKHNEPVEFLNTDNQALYASFLSERDDTDQKKFLKNKFRHDLEVSKSTDDIMSLLMKNNPRFFSK